MITHARRRRFNVGEVPVLNNPPACRRWHTLVQRFHQVRSISHCHNMHTPAVHRRAQRLPDHSAVVVQQHSQLMPLAPEAYTRPTFSST